MAEVNTYDNRESADEQPGRAKGPAQQGVHGPARATRERTLLTLSPAECFDLLEPGGVGRVGFASATRS